MKINEIITETVEVDEVSQLSWIDNKKGPHSNNDPKTIKDVKAMKLVKVGQMDSGHEIYYEKTKMPGSGWVSYYAVAPDGKVDLGLGAYEKGNVLSKLNLYAINKNNTLKAHNFYAYLITKLNKVLVAKEQSPGGHAVWKQLQKYHRDINIHGWSKGKAVNIDMNDPEYTHAPEYSGYNNPDSPETIDAEKMELVASKKQ